MTGILLTGFVRFTVRGKEDKKATALLQEAIERGTAGLEAQKP